MIGEYIYVIEILIMIGDGYDPPKATEILWTDDESLIKIFLSQHNINLNLVHVVPYPRIEMDQLAGTIDISNESDKLGAFYFKSVKDNKVHKVISTSGYLSRIIDELANDMVESMTFGELITREDVEFSVSLQRLVEQLPYAAVYDWAYIDDNIDPYGTDEYDDGVFPKMVDSNLGLTYDPLHHDSFDASNYDTPQPITLEGYVHYFTRMLMI